MKDYTKTSFWLLFAVLIPIEGLSALLAYETLGEVISAFYFIAILLNVPIIFAARRSSAFGSTAGVVLALAIIPYQFYLAKRLFDVQKETALIVAYAHSEKSASGQYPTDLSRYEFTNKKVEPFIQDYHTFKKDDGFIVLFRVGTKNTSHWYDTKTGWGYYPD